MKFTWWDTMQFAKGKRRLLGLWGFSWLLLSGCGHDSTPTIHIELNDSLKVNFPDVVGDHQSGFLLLDSVVDFDVVPGPWIESRFYGNAARSLLVWGQFYSDSSLKTVHVEGGENESYLKLGQSVFEKSGYNKLIQEVIVGYPTDTLTMYHLGASLLMQPGTPRYTHVPIYLQVQHLGNAFPEVFRAYDALLAIEKAEDFDPLMRCFTEAVQGDEDGAGFELRLAYGMAMDSISVASDSDRSWRWNLKVQRQAISYQEMTDYVVTWSGYRMEMMADHEGYFSEYEFVRVEE